MSEPTDQNQGLTPPYYSPPTYSYGPFGPPEEPFKFPWLNLILFLLTVGSTMFFGAYMAHYDADIHKFWIFLKYNPEWWLDGLPFSITLMVILLSHELGHYFFSRHHRVASSLPYFIPAPNLVGTFGGEAIAGHTTDWIDLIDSPPPAPPFSITEEGYHGGTRGFLGDVGSNFAILEWSFTA